MSTGKKASGLLSTISYYALTYLNLYKDIRLPIVKNIVAYFSIIVDTYEASAKCGWVTGLKVFAIAFLATLFFAMSFVLMAIFAAFAVNALITFAATSLLFSGISTIRRDATGVSC